MNTQSRDKTLLETIHQGLYLASVQNTNATLGDRSSYIGLSEIAKFSECPRAAVLNKIRNPADGMDRLLATQRGHWFENGVKSALEATKLNHFQQLEIDVRRKNGNLKAHLDFTLVLENPVKAVCILEVKSTERIPDAPWDSHVLQAGGQVNLLRHYWNRPVFSLRNNTGEGLHENMSFPQLCRERFGLELSPRPSSISTESWLLYLSMREAKAFGPYVYSSEMLESVFNHAQSFHQALKSVVGDTTRIDELGYPRGFYPLCGYCEGKSDCPKFREGSYQPQWEPALRKLEMLRQKQEQVHVEIKEIEEALKQAHSLTNTNDWIDTGAHCFRMSMVSGRKSLNQGALKMELSDIFHGMGSKIDIEALFAGCMKQGASFPRLTISAVN